MALQTSGAISFSQIVAEFGGVGSHSLSEYRALAGKGVSGIPASGTISFSHFHGKSKNVTTSVWTSSGYNTTSWQHWRRISPVWYSGNNNNYPGDNYFHYMIETANWNFSANAHGYGSGNANSNPYYTSGYQFYKGAHFWTNNRNNQRVYYIEQYQQVTTWVDTSSYQNQTTTAQITT